jgi:hypothetical protein
MCAVNVNGKILKIEDAATQSTLQKISVGDGTIMQVHWQLFAPGIGPYVEIETGNYLLQSFLAVNIN